MGDGTGPKIAAGCTCCCLVFVMIIILIAVSLKDVEVDEMALKWGTLTCSLGTEVYSQGKHHVWPGYRFIKYTKRYQFVELHGPNGIDCLSQDGLLNKMDVSFQYRMIPEKLRDVVLEWGEQHILEKYIIRLAQDSIREACAMYPARDYYIKRGVLSDKMEEILRTRMTQHDAHANLIFLQLKYVLLPKGFENAIELKQDAQVEINRTILVDREVTKLIAEERRQIANLTSQRDIFRANALANATVIASDYEAEGIEAEFDQIVLSYRNYTKTLGLSTLEFARSYLASNAMKKAGLPIYLFEPGKEACAGAAGAGGPGTGGGTADVGAAGAGVAGAGTA